MDKRMVQRCWVNKYKNRGWKVLENDRNSRYVTMVKADQVEETNKVFRDCKNITATEVEERRREMVRSATKHWLQYDPPPQVVEPVWDWKLAFKDAYELLARVSPNDVKRIQRDHLGCVQALEEEL